MGSFFQGDRDNEWTKTDRRERLKVLLTAAGFTLAVLGGLSGIIYAIWHA
jgi:hypothetical protein